MNISTQLLQAIANYLYSKPYGEVVMLLAKLQEEVKIKPEETKEEKPTDKE